VRFAFEIGGNTETEQFAPEGLTGKYTRNAVYYIFFISTQIKICITEHSLINIRLIEWKPENTLSLPGKIGLFGDLVVHVELSAKLPHIHIGMNSPFQKTKFALPSFQRERNIVNIKMTQGVTQFGISHARATIVIVFGIQ
jgi:hypothetical protein